jgi:hypothetical protein
LCSRWVAEVATITVVSAKGSPGVTTTVLGVGLAWPLANPGRSVVVVDADPAGPDTAAGILQGAAYPDAGLLALAADRTGEPADAVLGHAVALDPSGRTLLLPGIPDEARAAAMPLAWDVLAEARVGLGGSGFDLIVDAGRVSRDGAARPWVGQADVVVLVCRPTLPAVAAARRLVAAWPHRDLPLHLVVVDCVSPYTASEVAAAVQLPLLWVLPFELDVARVFSEGTPPGRGHDRSRLARSLRGLAGDLNALGRARTATNSREVTNA